VLVFSDLPAGDVHVHVTLGFSMVSYEHGGKSAKKVGEATVWVMSEAYALLMSGATV